MNSAILRLPPVVDDGIGRIQLSGGYILWVENHNSDMHFIENTIAICIHAKMLQYFCKLDKLWVRDNNSDRFH